MSLIKSPSEISKISEAAKIVAEVHYKLKNMVQEGVELVALDSKAKKIIEKAGGIPIFLGYQGFPNSICTSVNEVMVHGIPTNYKLKKGDIVSIDVGVKLNGYCADAAFTMGVGQISEKAKKLLKTSKKALEVAIKNAKPGIRTGDLGKIIEDIVIEEGFNVPRDYVGHGIGNEIHEDPYIPNYGDEGKGMKLREGMTICIEPMLIEGKDDLFVDPLDN